jgi:hypothetical protein
VGCYKIRGRIITKMGLNSRLKKEKRMKSPKENVSTVSKKDIASNTAQTT